MGHPDCSGVVLAGGASSRFGQDKALYRWQGRPLVHWVMQPLGEAGIAPCWLVANRDYPQLPWPVIPDVWPGGDSLSGIHAALHHARTDWVAVAACDLPRLNAAYWRLLLEARRPGLQAVVARGPGGFLEPLAALYHCSALPAVEERLQRGEYRLQSLLANLETAVMDWTVLEAQFGPQLFLNANRLADLG